LPSIVSSRIDLPPQKIFSSQKPERLKTRKKEKWQNFELSAFRGFVINF